MGYGLPSSVDPHGMAEHLADPPRNELGASQQHPESQMSVPPVDSAVPAPPAAPVKKRSTAKVVLIVVAGVAVVPASPSTAVATTAAASPIPAPTTPAPPATFKTVTAWYDGGGKVLIDTIGADNAAIRNDRDSAAVRHTCQKLGKDALHASYYAPIPDNQAQQHWAKSLPLIMQGASDCVGAIDLTGDFTLTTAVGEMNEGFDELNLVVARLNTLQA